MPEDTAYYLPVTTTDDVSVYDPTIHVQGAWSPEEQHMAMVAGLICHEVEQHEPRPEMQLVKLNFEILGFLALDRTEVRVRVARPGRTIELIEFSAAVRGREVVRGTAWRLIAGDSSAPAGTHDPAMAPPESFGALPFKGVWAGGYIASLEGRGAPGEPGRNQAWLSTPYPLVEGTTSGPVADFVRLVDTANGVAVRVDPREWMFPNVDLVIHLWRTPDPTWVGLDTRVSFGATGAGLTSTILNDVSGPLGRAEQILTVRPMPAPKT